MTLNSNANSAKLFSETVESQLAQKDFQDLEKGVVVKQ